MREWKGEREVEREKEEDKEGHKGARRNWEGRGALSEELRETKQRLREKKI